MLSCLVWGVQGYAQNKSIDSLQSELLKSQPDTNRIKILTDLAFRLRERNPKQAKVYRAEAWNLSEKFHFNKGKGWYYYLEGVNLIYQNKFSPAQKAELKAIFLGKQTKDYDLVGRAYNAIGIIHLRLEDDSSAMKAFTTALRYINYSTDQAVKPALLLNIGKLYAKLQNYPKALSFFEQSQNLYLKRNEIWGLSLSYLEEGNVYQVLKQHDKAIKVGNLSLAAAREVHYTRTKVSALILVGTSHLALNNLRKAKKNFDAASDSITLPNMHEDKLRIYDGYAVLYEKENNYQAAFLYKRKATLLSDSILNANRSRLILEYQDKFQTTQKETENKILRDQQGIAQNRFRQRNQFVYLTLVILFGFVLFSSVLYYGNRHIKKKNQLLTIQKDQIQKQKDDVEQLNHIKDKLFSLIAHDLRSPFSSMNSMIDMYDEGAISNEDLDFFFKEIRKDIGFNSLLLDNLLIWAKSQLYGFNIEPKPVSVERLADQVLYHFKKQFESKEINIQKDIPTGSTVLADYEMTNTVIRNLIGNAIKFTPKKGSIKISCIKYDDKLQIQISDSGIGISEENKVKIFQDTFFTTQGLNKEKGTGLGLQICKEFIEKNDGRIWVESELGIGSTFCFTLPVSIEQPVESTDMSNEDHSVQKVMKDGIRDHISLQIKYDLYELLSEASLETIWDTDLLSQETSWNEALQLNFGYPDEKTSIEWWAEKVHPDDRVNVRQSVQTAIKGKSETWENEYRFLCADGVYRYVYDRGVFLYDESAMPYRFMGIMRNIETQKNAVKEIQRLSLVATSVNNMVVISDSDDKVIWVNEAFESQTGYKLVDVIGEPAQQLLSGSDTNQLTLKEMRDGLKSKNFSAELINYKKDGDAYWVQIDTTQFQDPITNKPGYVSVQTIITERKENERIISEQNKTLKQIAYICSNDVQLPLYSILRLIKQLNNTHPEQKEFHEGIALLDMNAEKLDALIYEIHNQISKIERESA